MILPIDFEEDVIKKIDIMVDTERKHLPNWKITRETIVISSVEYVWYDLFKNALEIKQNEENEK